MSLHVRNWGCTYVAFSILTVRPDLAPRILAKLGPSLYWDFDRGHDRRLRRFPTQPAYPGTSARLPRADRTVLLLAVARDHDQASARPRHDGLVAARERRCRKRTRRRVVLVLHDKNGRRPDGSARAGDHRDP